VTRASLALPLLLLIAAPARAAGGSDVLQSDPEVGGRAVFFRPKDADRGTWGPGVQVRGSLGGAYGFEGSLDRARHTAAGADYTVTPLQLSLLGYFVPEQPLSAYLLAGMGWYFTRVGGPGAHSETPYRLHAGAGLQLLAGGNWTLDGSYRFLWNSVWRFNDWGHPWGTGYHAQGSMFTLSLNWRL